MPAVDLGVQGFAARQLGLAVFQSAHWGALGLEFPSGNLSREGLRLRGAGLAPKAAPGNPALGTEPLTFPLCKQKAVLSHRKPTTFKALSDEDEITNDTPLMDSGMDSL